SEILELNASQVAPFVRGLADELFRVAKALDQGGQSGTAVVRDLLERGNRGRSRVPVKRGELAGAFRPVRVSVDDQPGRLARLLTDAGAAGVNVEDVHVEHVPGRPQGIIELLVDVASVDPLKQALTHAGWLVLHG